MIEIKVPPLGESIVEATVARWLKREGDAVVAGETLVELETDKVTVEVPATKDGVLVRRAHQEGDVVHLDDLLATVDETAAAAPVAAPAPVQPAAAPPAPAIAPGTPAAGPAPPSVPPPAAPLTPERAAFPGTAARGETSPVRPAADVRASPAARRIAGETGLDLASVPGTGRGGVVSKPDVIGHLGELFPAGTAAAQTGGAATVPPVAEPAARQPPPVASQETPRRAESAPPLVHAEPPAPTGAAPAAPAAPAPAPFPAAGAAVRERREKMSTRRRRIAEHLLEAQRETAHLTTFNELDMSALEALRGRIRDRIEREHGVRLSFMPFFVRAVCRALSEFPVVNARIDGEHIVYHDYVNMGVAVASEAGLVVPSVKDADRKGLLQIARDIIDLARKARDGKLTMDDLTGGTFTITNGGVFGSLLSTPLINVPQAAILGLHRIQERPIAVDGRVEVRPMMYVALSYDHRLIDGEQAVRFLVRVRELLEDPAMMVVD